MLAFFRRMLSSWLVVALLGVLMIAFIVTGVGTSGGGIGSLVGGGVQTGAVASVGGAPVLAVDAARRAEAQLAQARQRRPDATMAQLLAAIGGPNGLTEQLVTGKLLEVYAQRRGLVASDKLVDGELASIPAFQGPTGRFDQRQMEALLAQQRLTLPALRAGIREDLVRAQLIAPMAAGAAPGPGLVNPYAALLIARREGAIGLVPVTPAALPAPAPAEVAAWYKGHLALYTLPERRVLRYALVGLDTVAAAAPTESEIAQRYRADAATYAASETRTLSQVVLPDEAAARALAARVAGGTPFAKAAADAGFAARDIALGTLAKPAFAASAGPAVADAAFAAAKGGTTAPVRSPLGWHVVHVDAIVLKPARTLEQVRGEIAAALADRKRADALAATAQRIGDAVDGGASFDEIVKRNGLAVTTSPAITAAGKNPADPGFAPDPALAALLKSGFAASSEDGPSLETVTPAKRFALLSVANVLAAAPQPLAAVQARAADDLRADRASRAAAAVARQVLAKVDRGQPLAAALAAAGLAAPLPAGASQFDVIRSGQQPPAPLRTLFTLAPGRNGIVAGPNGWYVVHLDRIVPGPPALLPAIAAQMRQEFSRTVSDEYLEQFAKAARAGIAVRYNPAAIVDLGRQLTGQAPLTRP